MAELLSPTTGNPPIENSGPGVLIADNASRDSITNTTPAVEIQHDESSLNAPGGGICPPAESTADVVGESVAGPDELELQNALERDLCHLTIQKAEIEAERERLEAVNVEGGKDVVGTVEIGELHEEEDGKNAGNVGDENKSGWGYAEIEGRAKPDNLLEEKGGEYSVSVEDENWDRWGFGEKEEMLKVENFHEEKGGRNAVNVEDENGVRLGYVENEGALRLDNLHGGKGETNGKRFEDDNVDGWGYMENEGAWKHDNLHEANVWSVEDQNEDRWGFMENEETRELNNLQGKMGGENTEYVEDQNENKWGFVENARGSEDNKMNGGSRSGNAVTKFGRYNQNSNNRKINYPMRPGAEDCAYYMKSGCCKFGSSCKFNHPPRRNTQVVKERAKYGGDNSERGGQTECKYYLASGGCRYGENCRFSHDSDNSSKSQVLEFNFLGLPIRSGEKECPFYMRTGTCKYASNCRFHHPEPTTVGEAASSSGYDNGGSISSQLLSSSSVPSWSSPMAVNEASSFRPSVFSGGQGAPSSDPEWSGYQAPNYTTSNRSLPTPPAFALSNLPTEISFLVLDEYPERPGEPECSFFMKNGDCKFKSNCKFHHPKTHIRKPKADSFTLNDKGLPLRPDQPICTYYHRYGICKYGPACKYDHPSSFANLPTPFDQKPFIRT
ncbi:Zinc finger CCCH domain-containing protein 43 [Striga hermonthica]|uniref:Zinc finger CCCH domain-containing protein 43 n=1 Tax=Striga hermonthica TaxID=68872 RepID=A0A9N7NC15_STRHE|nr:Zinc finger CCCH domain-containing protein 43 [Striga hermonthica]